MAKFMANMRYSLKPEVEPSQYDELKNGSYEAFNSRCDETMVGVKFNHDKMVQCWVGYQTEGLTDMKAHETELAAQLILAQTNSEVDTETDAAVETKVEVGKGMQRLGRYSELSDAQRTLLAQTINESDLTWKADPYISIAEPEGVMGFA